MRGIGHEEYRLAVVLALLVGLVLFGLALMITRTTEGSVPDRDNRPCNLSMLETESAERMWIHLRPFHILLDFLFWAAIGLTPVEPFALILVPPKK